MTDQTQHHNRLTTLLAYAEETNPYWPFATLITDQQGNPLVQATDAAHISPIYHSESLALHQLITHKRIDREQRLPLTMYCTAEPDVLSLSAMYWAKAVHEVNIEQLIFAAPVSEINGLFDFGIDLTTKELMASCRHVKINIQEPVCQEAATQLFKRAKQRQLDCGKEHPAYCDLSDNLGHFYQMGAQ